MGQPELMTPAEFVRMYEKPPQVTLDGGQHIAMAKFIHSLDIPKSILKFVIKYIY